jgi:hypothetical protein
MAKQETLALIHRINAMRKQERMDVVDVVDATKR